ncbi:hypothetical protein NC652_031654 [Populus alba x Populus x berolinensis]|nr:hypothetical protein NC652_031654 [Populus alba x Populus x berolinensis]
MICADMSLSILGLLIGKALKRLVYSQVPDNLFPVKLTEQMKTKSSSHAKQILKVVLLKCEDHHHYFVIMKSRVHFLSLSNAFCFLLLLCYKKARCLRDYDNYATCHVDKFETVDTYYRRCSSAAYVGNVSVPLLCISALDDPVCTREAIPWDECRANPNIVLATPQHGGHLAFFEGLTASSSWWIRAVDEFLGVLRSSPYIHVQKKQTSGQHSALDSSIDQYPHLHVAEDGTVTAASSEGKRDGIEDIKNLQMLSEEKTTEILSNGEQEKHVTEAKSDFMSETCQTSEIAKNIQGVESPDITSPLRRFLNQISQQNSISTWLLAFIAIRTSWPLVGSITKFIFRKRSRKIMPAA